MKQNRHTKTTVFLLLTILFVIALIGIALMLFPQMEQLQYRDEIRQEVTAFKEKVKVYHEKIVMPETTGEEEETQVAVLPELYELMQQYNEEIFEEKQKDLVDAFSYSNPVLDLTEYGIDDGIVGVIHIPSINVEMPLYLGANWGNLSKGLAQLSQTSMPIGGKNTNCVIAGHRGWYGVPFLRDIEQVEVGDSVFLETPWETLEYRVCQEPVIILPDETENILIQEGRDLLTLLTCHPYSVCTHRFLLICERYEETSTVIPETKSYWTWDWIDRVTITTSNGIVVESSSQEIFVAEILPWLIAVSFLVLVLLSLVTALIILLCKRIEEKKIKKASM